MIYRDGLARLAETAEALVDLGYAADMIFTERFGPTGSRNRAA